VFTVGLTHMLTDWLWGGTVLATTTLPTTGAWHHVVFTWDGTTNRLYIDNAAPGTSTTAHQTATPTTAGRSPTTV
jgi:hypothetical protein